MLQAIVPIRDPLPFIMSVIFFYLPPGPFAPFGLPAPFGMREPEGLSTEAGRAPLALLQSGRALCTCLTPEELPAWDFTLA